ncbi:hypothetical protein BDL97_06G014000 [Sphagnum fallax]|nr:hypothetical protein BDL97_06G014000 [Sphagnum fallax]
MLLYPLYASIKAIKSPFKEDDQLWLTYWVLYSFVSLLELVAAPIFAWIPLWSTIKLAAAAWLVLPQFRGGIIVYEQYVRPYFYSTVQNADAKLTDTQRKFLSSISPEACSSVAQFINDSGSDAFDKIMAASVGSHGSVSLLFATKVMVWHFVRYSHKAAAESRKNPWSS